MYSTDIGPPPVPLQRFLGVKQVHQHASHGTAIPGNITLKITDERVKALTVVLKDSFLFVFL